MKYNPNDELSQMKQDIFSAFKKIDNLLETKKNHKPLAWKFEEDYEIEGHESDLQTDFFGFVKTKLSAIMHRHRMKKYSELSKIPYAFRIIAEGDSWFEHPLVDDIVDYMLDNQYAVCCFSEAGDLLVNMAKESEYLNAVKYELPKCFILSGGGNDLLSYETLNSIIDFSSQNYINQERLNIKMAELENSILSILKQIHEANPDLKVFMHGYDFIFPRKHKYMWVYPVLMAKNIIEPKDQRNIISHVINCFNQLLSKIEKNYSNRFYHVDLRGTLKNESDWADEIHPSETSSKIIAQIFLDKIHSVIPKQ